MNLEIVPQAALDSLKDVVLERLGSRIPLPAAESVYLTIQHDESALQDHLTSINRWAAEISFRDIWTSKALRNSFVDLDLHLGVARWHGNVRPKEDLRVSDLVNLRGHQILLGDPGAGKTTTLKQVAARALEMLSKHHTARLPILVRLRELGDRDKMVSTISGILGLRFEFTSASTQDFRSSVQRRIVANALDRLRCVVLVDGLDEIHPFLRDRIFEEIKALFLRVQKSRILITCRTGDYIYQTEGAQVMTLKPLTDRQIDQFAERWLGGEKAVHFLQKVRNNPYAGSEVRPLTLAHLCAIYERSGDVPEKPRTVYRKIVRLLLEEWDEQRGVRRYSRYSKFQVDRKEDFLEAIAYHIRRVRFTELEMKLAYLQIYEMFGLPKEDALRVARELESHTGLIVESSYGEYEFTHKAIHEYLTASFITKLPSVPSEGIETIPHEMALAVALSSHATRYCSAVIRTVLAIERPSLVAFAEPFLSRLLTERVDFVPDPSFGALFLLLHSTAYDGQTEDTTYHLRRRQSFFAHFLSIVSVKQSILAALEKSKIERTEQGYSRVSMPSSLPHVTVYQSDKAPLVLVLRVHEDLLALQECVRN